MKRSVWLAALVGGWAVLAQARSGWIVGENYLAEWNEQGLGRIEAVEAVESWSADPVRCEVRTLPAGSSRLVSDVADGVFYSVESGAAGSRLTRRNLAGEILYSAPFAEGADLLQIAPLSHGALLALLYRSAENRIWVRRLDANFTALKEIPVVSASIVWSGAKLLRDASTDGFWVGYSAASQKFSYTPTVAQFDAEGNRVGIFQWNSKGLFFDFCRGRDEVLMSRDLPTGSFTLPIYSFLESLRPGHPAQTVHEIEVNLFVDHLLCGTGNISPEVWMIQRSVFGSDGSYLARWDRGGTGLTQKMGKLPGPAKAFMECAVTP